MGSTCCSKALNGLIVLLIVAGNVKAAAPLGVVDGLFDSKQPRTLGLGKLTFTESVLYQATKTTYRFCHHPNLVQRGDEVWCMWSNGRVGEDEPGQRILFSKAAVANLSEWSRPQQLATDPAGHGACVASGWIVAGRRLVALYTVTGGTNFDPRTALFAREARASGGWTKPRRLVPGFFIAGPVRMPGGDLLLSGEHVGDARKTGRMALYRTSAKDGLSGWTRCPISPSDLKVFGYTEPAPYVREDGVVVCPFRNYSGSLYASESRDSGRSWSVPVVTNFPDSLARHATGRLPGGNVFLINNSSAKRLDRSILTIALSRDGRQFDRAAVIKNEETKVRFEGKHKLAGWQYPHAIVVGDELLVAYSVNKEDVRLARIPLAALKALK
ncbi:MAG: hypothetical protein CMJ68_20720 [Planctomycetaceae bacterium]|nr:hypothetical protein [Planctomycetaceae bacterium]